MATPALGHRVYSYTLRKSSWSHQSAQTASEHNIQKYTVCPPGSHHNGIVELYMGGTSQDVKRLKSGIFSLYDLGLIFAYYDSHVGSEEIIKRLTLGPWPWSWNIMVKEWLISSERVVKSC